MSFPATRHLVDENEQTGSFTDETYLVQYDATLCAVLRGEKCKKHKETLEHLERTVKLFHAESVVTTGESLASRPKFVHASQDGASLYVTGVKKGEVYTPLQQAPSVAPSGVSSFGYYSEQCDGLPWA